MKGPERVRVGNEKYLDNICGFINNLILINFIFWDR
jgi:hypothetical protein